MRHLTSRVTRLTGGAWLVLAALLMSVSTSSGASLRGLRLTLPPVPARIHAGLLTRRHLARNVPLTVSRHSLNLTPNGLRVADSNFAPATVNSSLDRVEDNSLADQDWFASPQYHSKTYESLGRVTGYYQRADWMPGGAQVIFRYQGSVMLDNATAQAAQQDATSYATAQYSAQISPCQTQSASGSAQTIPNCNYLLVQGTDNATQQPVYIENVAWAVNFCLIETSVQYPPALGGNSPTGTQIAQTVSNITNAAATLAQQLCISQGGPGPTATNTVPPPPGPTATHTVQAPSTATPTRTPLVAATPTSTLAATSTSTATATPTSTTTIPVQFELEDVRVEKNGAGPNLTNAPLLVVKRGQKVLLSIYVHIEQGRAGTPLSFDFSAKQGSTQLISRTIQVAVPATLPAELRETVTARPGKQGIYTFTGSVNAQGQPRHGSTKFTVVGSTKHQCVTIGGAQYCSNS